MSNQLLASKHELFTPRDLVTTPVEGKSFLKLYPKRNIGDVWSELETNLAFNVNCSTLQNSNLKKNVIIDTLSEQMGTSTQMHIYLQRYDSLGKTQFFNPRNLKVLSYHNKKGSVIEEAIRYVAGVETLKDRALRPQGIHFVKFQCNLDFSSLGVPDSAHSSISFYSCLPVTSNEDVMDIDENIPSEEQVIALEQELTQARANLEAATNDNRADALNMVTAARNAFNQAQDTRTAAIQAATLRANGANFNSPSTWLTDMNSPQELMNFLSPAASSTQLTPFLLSKPAFDSNIAQMNTKLFKDSFDSLVIELAYEPLKKVIFDYVCPTIKNEPFQLFQAVCQETPDPNDSSKKIRISVQQYADIFNGLMRSLSSDSEWLVDVHEYFIKNLSPDIREKMESDGYRAHMKSTSKFPFDQIKLMEEARRKALHAEKSLNSQAKMIQNQIQSSHGFFTNVSGEQVLFSPAERTMQHYKRSGEDTKKSGSNSQTVCWGCKKNTHRWYDKTLKKVVCPEGNNPAYIQAAAQARKELNAARRKANNLKRNNASKDNRALLEALLSSGKDLIIQHNSDVVEQAQNSSNEKPSSQNRVTFNLNSQDDDSSSKPSPSKKIKLVGGACFDLITNVILKSTNGKEPLPITLHPNLPHIKLQLGEPDSSFNPAILGIIDTGATLTVGYSEYVLGICESFPQLVKSIVWAEDKYYPIELSGVVSNDKTSSSSNNLSAVVTFHMPYLTTNNHSTSFSVAIGKHVAVNILIGMSFIRNSQLVIDIADSVAEAKMLQCQPFEIIFKQATRGKPHAIPADFKPDHAVFTTYSSMLDRIKRTREYLDNGMNQLSSSFANISTTVMSDSGSPEVSFHSSNDDTTEDKKKRVRDKEPVVVKKGNWTKKKKPNLFRDINLPDDLEGFDFLFEKTSGKVVSRSAKQMLGPDDIHPAFNIKFNMDIHGTEFNKRLKFHPDANKEGVRRITELVKEYWCCFCKANVQIPIKDYECHIDTGNAKPTVAKGIRFGFHERPIMQEAIDALLQKDQIIPDTESEWLSKPVLAPKPHQEEITGDKIDDFVWRFCISFIALNQVTKLISYPIPRCDDAVMIGIGRAKFRISMDAFSGYHQIAMEHASSLKTAFAGPHGRKYRYKVMPFGLVNGPVIFVIMVYDLKNHWDTLAQSWNININEETNSIIIIDDTFIYSNSLDSIIQYLRAILEISKRYNLSWKLEKCGFLDPRFEFVGVDVADIGNYPARSKEPITLMWKDKKPRSVRDLASFIGFVGYYRNWIPYFEERLRHTRSIIAGHDYSHILDDSDLPTKIYAEMNDILDALLSDPVLRRPDPNKRFYLRTDACKHGHGNVLLQPGDDEKSLESMKKEIQGHKCEFDISTSSKLRLYPIGFSGRKCSTAESYLHSFMNEALAVNFGIDKWRIFLWGKEFTVLTDCRALVWLLSYEGTNAAVCRLQFEILGYWFTICHRSAAANADTDGLSRLSLDFAIDPGLQEYYSMASTLKSRFPCVDGDIQPDNLPGFRRNTQKRNITKASNLLLHPSTSPFNHSSCTSPRFLQNTPVAVFSTFSSDHVAQTNDTCCDTLHHQPLIATALQSRNFNWVINRFGSGAFFSVCNSLRIPFTVPLAADTTFKGRSLLHEYGKVNTIVNDSYELLQAIQTSTLKFHGYFVTAPWSVSDKEERLFFNSQRAIIHHLQVRCQLSIFFMHIHLDIHSHSISSFIQEMTNMSWNINQQKMHFPSFNDAVDDSAIFIIGINIRQVSPNFSQKLQIKLPPIQTHSTLQANILHEYNLERYAFLECPELDDEELLNENFRLCPNTTSNMNDKLKSRISHHLTYAASTSPSTLGTKICDIYHPCIPLENNNNNPFKNMFGIRYTDNGKTWIRSISCFELASCFGLERNLKLKLSEDKELFILLYRGCPSNTMAAIISEIYQRLLEIRDDSIVIDDFSRPDPPASDPISITAPAATAFNILNGSTCIKLPTKIQWDIAYKADTNCQLILEMLQNPGLINKNRLNEVHYRYRQPLRSGSLVLEDGFIILKESIDSQGFVKLRIVPEQLWNVIFLAFHSNPIGGHFSVYYTFHRIRLRFFWPRMYQYIKQMCKLCAACSLSNSTHQRSKELLYSFPTDAPFKLVVADIYKAGDITAFQGEKGLFVLLDHMTGFAIVEELLGLNSTIFAKVMMKILLQHGFCHTVIVDADSKFRGIFKETMNMLDLNVHWASGNNHDSIMVERFNAYLNKGLKILCTERSTTRTFVESAQLLAYAWNSAPMAETDISRSLVAVGREFSFPIDYIDTPTPSLDVDATTKQQYHEQLKVLLKNCRDVYKVLVDEHRCMHREYVNSRRPDPIIFKINDLVWNRRQIQSNSKRGIVGKLRFKQTGPWKVIEKLSGGSYKLQFHDNPKRIDKKHASELSLFPHKLIPFPQLAGSDNAYSKLHKTIQHNPFSEAGLKSYNDYDLAQTWQLSNPQISFAKHLPSTHYKVEPFPTLQQLNDELQFKLETKFHHGNMDLAQPSFINNSNKDLARINNTVLPDHQNQPKEVITQATSNVLSQLPATAAELMANFIANEDKLCFIRHNIPSLHRYEWRLVQIELSLSIQKNPTTLATGHVLATFYIAHPSDLRFNAPNQRFWKQYHFDDNNLVLSHKYHLVRPNKDERNYCTQHNLKPYQEWINIHDKDTFLLGPFDFATINNRKSNDRVPSSIWNTLHSLECRVNNPLPPLDVNTQGYVCHIDTPFHSEHQSQSISASINTVLSQRYFDN